MDNPNLKSTMLPQRWLGLLICVLCVLHPSLALTFTEQPTGVTLKQGLNVILVCAVDQTENIVYAWRFNDAPLQDSAQIYMGTSNELKIIAIEKENAGVYQCVVTDTASGGSITSDPAVVNVTWAPEEVRVQLKSPSTVEEVEEGVRVTLICKASGNPPPDRITWVRDGVEVAAGPNVDLSGSRLKIKSATALDSGMYSCRAGNSIGTTDSASDVTLDITDSNTPLVVVAPQDTLSAVGDSVEFHCQFSGEPTPPVEWFFLEGTDASTPLVNDTNAGTFIYENGTLVMETIQANDEGVYQCVPITPHGRPFASARLMIAIVDPLPSLGVQLVAEDTLNTINCTYPDGAPGGVPTPTIRWLKPNGREVPLDDTRRVHAGEQGNLLTFDPIRKQDEGNYTCRASNMAGEESQTLSLVVATVPKIHTKPQDIHVKEYKEAVLHCGASATPSPTIKWSYKDKDAANKRGVTVLGNGTLFIHSAAQQHNGTYTCKATTVAGSKTASASIFVIAVLKFISEPVTKDLDRGLNDTLVCHATAATRPAVRWIKLGSIPPWPTHVSEPESGVLQFAPVQQSDAGHYMCIATTGLETINATINVNVVIKPKFDIMPNNTVGYEGYALRIDCRAYGDPVPTITWLSKHITRESDPAHFQQLENGSLLINAVKASDAGKYQCIAGSDAGLNTTEITISVSKGKPPVTLPVGSDAMVRTIAIAVGCAVAYILLVVGLMLWCRQRRRRHRRKLQSAEKPNGVVAGGTAGANDPMLNDYHDGENGKVVDGEAVGMGTTATKNHHHHHQRGSYDKLQFPRHDMQTITVIGHGAYGEVSLARAAGIKDGEEATTVMVKALQTKEESLQLDFRREIEMLCKLNHDNIVKLLGVCRDSEPQLMITEYLDWGDLKQFLQATRGENGTKNVPPPLTLSQKLDAVHQVAMGMEHLSASRFIHGDLAARNCLLSPSMEVKICTMSASQDLYRAEYHEYHQKLIPVRWMPAEAVFEDELSTKSDVWAFGVFVWEVFSQGRLPYRPLDDDAVMRAMIDGELVLETPADTPEEVELLMHRCWADSPKDRHTFADITHLLGRMSVDSRV